MNHIENIEIKNFKSIKHAEIKDCRRVNVFIGYPNVGKSNILEAIGLLTFIRQKRPTGLKGLIRFERFTQIFNFFKIQEPAIINFNGKFSLEVKYEDERRILLQLFDNNEKKLYYKSSVFGIYVGNETLHSSQTNDIDNFSGRFSDLENFQVKPYKFNYANKFNETFSALELKVPNGENLSEVVSSNSQLTKEFSDLLKPNNLSLVIDTSTNDISINLKKSGEILYSLPLSMIADTLQRLIFHKAAILSNKKSVLLFEEPEAHMFPPYISKFTSEVTYDENGNQFFIATHSPYVVNDFMENLENDELAIFTVGYDKETGETLIRKMDDEDMHEIYQYGVDIFLNLENFVPHAKQQ